MRNESKKEIWEEIVISNLRTQNGKIKVVIADAGFFAYDNILLPLNCRTIPVIKVKSNIDVNYQPLKGLASFPTLYVSCSTCSHCKVG